MTDANDRDGSTSSTGRRRGGHRARARGQIRQVKDQVVDQAKNTFAGGAGQGRLQPWPTAAARRPSQIGGIAARSTGQRDSFATRARSESPGWPTPSRARWNRCRVSPEANLGSDGPGRRELARGRPRWCSAPLSPSVSWRRGSSRAPVRTGGGCLAPNVTTNPAGGDTRARTVASYARGREGHETPRAERSIGELFGELSQDVALLVRQEAQLAKTEMQQKLSKVTTDLVSLATGGVVALRGWAGADRRADPAADRPGRHRAVARGAAGGRGARRLPAGSCCSAELNDLKRTDPTPRRTVESIKEDIQWAKEQRP